MTNLNDPPFPASQVSGRPNADASEWLRAQTEEPPLFLEYWRAIRMRMWSILTLATLVAAVAWFVVSQIKPTYRSTATVLVESTKAKVTSIEDVYSGIGSNREYFQTQAESLKSRDIARRVVDKLGLTTHPEFDPRIDRRPQWQKAVLEHVPALEELFAPPPALDEAQAQERVLRMFGTRLSVEPVRLSQLVKVNFEANDPQLAAAVANAVVERYIQADIETRSGVTSNAGDFINSKLNELKGKLDASERALQNYRDREGLLDSKTTVLGGTGRQMDELTQKLVEARVRRSEAEEAYNQAKAGESSNYETVPAVARNVAVQRAREIEADAEKRHAEVSQRYGPDHPRMVSADSELKSAKANTRRQIETVLASISKEYNAARATEKTVEDALQQSKGSIQSVNRKEIRAAELEREAATNRQLYQTFLSRYKETSATVGAEQPVARIIDRASPALLPIRPVKWPAVGITFGLSLLLGAIVASILKQLNNTITTVEDVEFKLKRPLIAALPQVSGGKSKDLVRAIDLDAHSAYSESIRTAATGITMSSLDQSRKVFAVTSSVPGEGKSTTVINLALFHARLKPTLLVDADMRKPVVAASLGLVSRDTEPHPGLSELVAGIASLEECLQTVEGTNLKVISSGRIPPNPLELLASARFKVALHQLSQQFDMVFIDTPPVQLVSDALMIAKASTGLIFVVRSDETPVPLVRTALKRIAALELPLMGVVLNGHDFKRAERYYGEYSGYGKYGYKDYYGKAA